MMVVLLIAGIGILLAGLLAIGFGIPVKEFSFGNTLILTGVVAACTGMMMLGLWMVVRELKNLALQLGSGVATTRARERCRSARQPQAPRRAIRPGKRRFPVRPRPARRGKPRRCRTGGAPSALSPAAMAGRGRVARSPAQRSAAGAAGGRSRAGRQAAAQSVVFFVVAEGTRARRGANDRSIRG